MGLSPEPSSRSCLVEGKRESRVEEIWARKSVTERSMVNCRRRSSSSSWSDLYPELILSISQHLKTRFDILSFRGVCKRWREYSLPLSPNFLSPLLPLRFHTELRTLPRCFSCNEKLDLFVESIYLITPIVVDTIGNEDCSSWMVMATERKPGEIELTHPLTGWYIKHLPETLDLTKFRVSELDQGYRVDKSLCSSIRMISPSMFSPGDFTAIFLYAYSYLGAFRLSRTGDFRGNSEWSEARHEGDFDFDKLDDLVSYKGIHVAVDPYGRLFSVEFEAENTSPLVVTGVLAGYHICNKGRKKLLVVDPLSDKLYMVERKQLPGVRVKFNVYKFNEERKRWDKVKDLCHDRALFVGVRHCFFAPSPIGNCIVFGNGSFCRLRGCSMSDRSLFRNAEEQIGVYHLGGQEKFSFISDYPELVRMMQPPPACFSTSGRDSNEHEALQPDFSRQEDPCLSEEVSRPLERPESQEQTTEIPSTGIPTMNDVERVADVEAFNPETSMEEITLSLSRSDKSHTTVKFKGLDIRSNLVPTLRNIWLKHGNIIENTFIHNGEIIISALELLANMVLILESNSARSLTDSQAGYLSSALSDLRGMHFKVDWLAPFVEKALALHKSKPLVDSLDRLRQSKDQAVVTRSKHLDEVAKLDNMVKEFEENMAAVSKMIPIEGQVDLDQPLGVGLI